MGGREELQDPELLEPDYFFQIIRKHLPSITRWRWDHKLIQFCVTSQYFGEQSTLDRFICRFMSMGTDLFVFLHLPACKNLAGTIPGY